jgi:hypothetical protein
LQAIILATYETSRTFEPGGEESVDSITYVRIHFKPVPGACSPAATQLRGKSYPVPLSGSIWIEPQSSAVTRLVASKESTLSDLGIQAMRSAFREPCRKLFKKKGLQSVVSEGSLTLSNKSIAFS